jgi:hypothetical protein
MRLEFSSWSAGEASRHRSEDGLLTDTEATGVTCFVYIVVVLGKSPHKYRISVAMKRILKDILRNKDDNVI